MKRFLHVILVALALLLMGARDLPRPCLGDGMGNACAMDLCQCTALCSCRSVCGDDAAAADASGPACHMHAAGDPAASPAHFSLPEPKPPTLLVASFAGLLLPQVARAVSIPRPDPYLAPTILPPEPPPRIRA